ncbi:hypothetical protein BS78_K110500 [Paspalum vaginatum]|uniref:Uncharacterized protein n=1 Tax=Paspalum vaginatum TaxID=158149 RepID=A0A9W8CFA4_9POAL|nr:hypothetical protein BS78_K110500 [Paspalum vaginatum]
MGCSTPHVPVSADVSASIVTRTSTVAPPITAAALVKGGAGSGAATPDPDSPQRQVLAFDMPSDAILSAAPHLVNNSSYRISTPTSNSRVSLKETAFSVLMNIAPLAFAVVPMRQQVGWLSEEEVVTEGSNRKMQPVLDWLDETQPFLLTKYHLLGSGLRIRLL